jgi:hypothetical protein
MDEKRGIDGVREAIVKMDEAVEKLKYNATLRGAWENARVKMIESFGEKLLDLKKKSVGH